jgi:pseudaminic acid biosynthesis-associated methylase
MNLTKQEKIWSENFGKEYTDRFYEGVKQIEKNFIQDYGISRQELDSEFLGDLDKNIKILEVGCNIGMKLYSLQKLGFKYLYGIDVQRYAVERSKEIQKNLDIIYASGYDIPYKDGYFDLVYTSGVLIHIPSSNIKNFLSEIYRCSSKYIWGWEYFAENYEEVEYRGKKELLWKNDFSKLFTETFQDLKLIKTKKVELQKEKGKYNCMYLLKKN